jgi:uncharacterized protein (DUF58 family)
MSAAPDRGRRLLSLVRRVVEGRAEQPELPPARPPREAQRVLDRLDWQVLRRLDGLLQGDYRSWFLGSGLDLAEIREYQPGDDVRAIEWNVTARTGIAHVRRYEEERSLTAWLLLDRSESVRFGTTRQRKSDLLVDLSGSLARLLTRRGNRVGALLFSDGVDQVLPARGGRAQALNVLHHLLASGPATARVTNLAAAFREAARTIRRRSLIIVLSDFLSSPGWEADLGRLARRHEVVAVWLKDPREEELPNIGQVVLQDAETGEQITVDTNDEKFRARFVALAAARRERLERICAACGVEMLEISTEQEMPRVLAAFIQRRRRLHPARPGYPRSVAAG